MNIVVAGVAERHQLCCVVAGLAVVATKNGVQIELGLDPTLVDGALCLWDDCLLHPLDDLDSWQLTKNIVVEVAIVFALGAHLKKTLTLK